MRLNEEGTGNRERKMLLLLSQMEALLNRFLFLSQEGIGVTDIVERGNNWFGEAEARGSEICRFDT